MTRVGVLTLSLLVCAALPAMAADSEPAPGGACLSPRMIQSWNNLDDQSIVVRAVGGKYWRLDLGGGCLGLKDAIDVRVALYGVGVCVDKGDYISYRYHQFGPQRCLITGISPYVPENDDNDSSGE